MAPPAVTVADLANSANLLLALLQSFVADLSQPPTSPPPQKEETNPLDLLHSAATLLKAQTTKLSLLLINDPFTPSAAKTMLSDMASGPCPALVTAAQLCAAPSLGSTMRDEARTRTRRLLTELQHLLREVLAKTASPHAHGAGTPSRDPLASTGVVWAACDAAAALRTLGVPGLLAQRAEEQRAMLEDAAAELREWRDDADDEGFESDESPDETDAPSLERLLGAAHRLPSGRADLRALLDASLRKLRLAGTLCAAVAKRRFGTLAGGEVARADAALARLKRVPAAADELAARFYELDEPGARAQLGVLAGEADRVAALLGDDWAGGHDAFTAWAGKWRAAMAGDGAPGEVVR